MKKIFVPAAAAALVVLAGCAKGQVEPAPQAVEQTQTQSEPVSVPEDAVPGVMVVKFSTVPRGIDEIRDFLPGINVREVQRTFPDDPRFPKRIKASGMDRWYNIGFDNAAVSMTKAAKSASGSGKVECVDFVVSPTLQGASPYLFNDTRLAQQWHYYNDGTYSYQGRKSVVGADINLLEAWKVQTGKEDVIVAIVDGGIAYSHEDLAGSMWVNQAEMDGVSGTDDDGNGYVDDIYGYNFCTYEGYSAIGTIVPQDHGTHVAGTVAAVNNNGKGVCGIAGGDGTHKGIRLMSTQTNQSGTIGAYISQAFYYAANNGAVVCNCSWEIKNTTSPSVEEAIRYFCKYAGLDDDGKQTGPIAGGVVVFAAGNDASTTTYPGKMDEVISVSSFGPDMKAAYYTNYGSWVDICAPGGDQGYFGTEGGVLSTIPSGYGYMQGTSMAAPHVTGVAALVASQYKKKGMTAKMVEEILLSTANKDLYDHNPSYKTGSLLGAGRLDAGAAMGVKASAPPKISAVSVSEVKANKVTISMVSPSIPEGYSAINSITVELKGGTMDESAEIEFNTKPGGKFSYAIAGLDFSTEYTFKVTPKNILGDKGESTQIVFTTGANTKPVIKALDTYPITMRYNGIADLRFDLSDADEHEISLSISGETSGIKSKVVSSNPYSAVATLSFDAIKMTEGSHTVVLELSDGYETVTLPVGYTVLPNAAPQAKEQIPNVVFGVKGESKKIDLSAFFQDEDKDELEFTVEASKGEYKVVETTVSGSSLTLKAAGFGYSTVTVKATDPRKAFASQEFQVLLRDSSNEVDLYPMPVVDVLNIRMAEEGKGTLIVFNVAGGKVLEQEISYGPFNPATVDFSKLEAGSYVVVLKTADKEIKQNIVKE